jgi:hypothetical protein
MRLVTRRALSTRPCPPWRMESRRAALLTSRMTATAVSTREPKHSEPKEGPAALRIAATVVPLKEGLTLVAVTAQLEQLRDTFMTEVGLHGGRAQLEQLRDTFMTEVGLYGGQNSSS